MKNPSRRWASPLLLAVACTGCTTAGSTWMGRAEYADDAPWQDESTPAPARSAPEVVPADASRASAQVLSTPLEEHAPLGDALPEGEPSVAPKQPPARRSSPKELAGRVLGTFRNTYYDFPSEGDFQGDSVPLRGPKCEVVRQVPRGFYEAVCVQGSGQLVTGQTVSFHHRDCECAEVCPRTGQKICFEALDVQRFPWGRGATGKGITPLRSVAVDTTVIPLGTVLYVPEFDGISLDDTGSATHDGCFVAEDRGMKVQGQHLDVYTGRRPTTKLWNRLVPSNSGVTVVLDSPHCRQGTAR